MSARLGVVHLVWGPLGAGPLRAFLSSYRRLDPGEEHELILVFNGVGSERSQLLAELAGVEHRLLELERPVLDLAAYFQVARRVAHKRLCFLNSYSEPLVADWLGLLARAAAAPGAGIVGASGSWASLASDTRYLLGFGGPYAAIYRELGLTSRGLAELAHLSAVAGGECLRAAAENQSSGASGATGGSGASGALSLAGRLRRRTWDVRILARQSISFAAFPAPHLRTNGFLIERELMLRLRPGALRAKPDAWALESGRRSLTRQVERLGMRALLVGRDGRSYEARDWPESHTFRQGAQENLLIADNHTRAYERADLALRRALSAQAWGDRADARPALSASAAPASARAQAGRRAEPPGAATAD